MSARGARSHVRDPGVGESPPRDEVVVQHAELHPSFESFLAEVSTAISVAAPGDMENIIGRSLDQLAQQLGAERCTRPAAKNIAWPRLNRPQ